MKYLPWILLGVVVYVLIRLQNERAKTDFQVNNLKAAIPDPASLQPQLIQAVTPEPFDYATSYNLS